MTDEHQVEPEVDRFLEQEIGKLGGVGAKWMSHILSHNVGEQTFDLALDADELRAVARRIVTAKKLYNVREGWTAAEDTLPKRFLSEGLPAGGERTATLPRERLQAMVAAYYAARGWDAEGRPTPTTLERLRLDEYREAVPA